MPVIDVYRNGEGLWPDLPTKVVHHVRNDIGAIAMAGLPGGMEKGRTSVSIRIDLPNGEVVIAETSLRPLLQAAAAFRGWYGEE